MIYNSQFADWHKNLNMNIHFIITLKCWVESPLDDILQIFNRLSWIISTWETFFGATDVFDLSEVINQPPQKWSDSVDPHNMSSLLLFVKNFLVLWMCFRHGGGLLWMLSLDISTATLGSWLNLLTLSCLFPNKQSSQLTACQPLFETISTHAPLKHARPIKRQWKTNRATQLSSEQNQALPGGRLGGAGTP